MPSQLRHKFGAIRTEYQGRQYPSKLEATCAAQLGHLRKSGLILFHLEQVPFHLPGGLKYVCDFQAFYSDGGVLFMDAKGTETKEFKAKMRLMAEAFPHVQVLLIRKAKDIPTRTEGL